jgi:hypothetical protein
LTVPLRLRRDVLPLTPDVIKNRRIDLTELGLEAKNVLGKQALAYVAVVVGLMKNESRASLVQ